MVKFLGAFAQRKLLHILRRCGVSWFVQMSQLRKLCNCSKSSAKNAEHLRVYFKSFRANPNVSASLQKSDQMRESVTDALAN
jgi:hypothetical protein